jgi:hypothetical protein
MHTCTSNAPPMWHGLSDCLAAKMPGNHTACRRRPGRSSAPACQQQPRRSFVVSDVRAIGLRLWVAFQSNPPWKCRCAFRHEVPGAGPADHMYAGSGPVLPVSSTPARPSDPPVINLLPAGDGGLSVGQGRWRGPGISYVRHVMGDALGGAFPTTEPNGSV